MRRICAWISLCPLSPRCAPNSTSFASAGSDLGKIPMLRRIREIRARLFHSSFRGYLFCHSLARLLKTPGGLSSSPMQMRGKSLSLRTAGGPDSGFSSVGRGQDSEVCACLLLSRVQALEGVRRDVRALMWRLSKSCPWPYLDANCSAGGRWRVWGWTI